ncbi:Hypothetical protein A7982_06164 [Minicystis rosea]|nr:Hypothetical protein A7982_06164 [Minicystis rosea]
MMSELYEIYQETLVGPTREEFEKIYWSNDDSIMARFYGVDGALAGFAESTVRHVESRGRTYAVHSGAVVFSLAYRGGFSTVWFGMKEFMRIKLREPTTPAVFITRAVSPASYQLMASLGGWVYPSRHRPTPPEVEALVFDIARQLKLKTDPANPWFQSAIARIRQPERLARSAALKNNPDADFYRELTRDMRPDQMLILTAPVNLANIAVTTSRLVAAIVRTKLRKVGTPRS